MTTGSQLSGSFGKFERNRRPKLISSLNFRGLLISVAVVIAFFPEILLHGSSRVYFPGIDGWNGAYGDALIVVWQGWILSTIGFFNHLNLWNSFPWGEVGWAPGHNAQIGFLFELGFFAKCFGPILGWNLMVFVNMVTVCFGFWWASIRMRASQLTSFALIVPSAMSQPFVWMIGGPSAMTMFWPFPFLLALLIDYVTKGEVRHKWAVIACTLILLLSDPFLALGTSVVWIISLAMSLKTQGISKFLKLARYGLVPLGIASPFLFRALSGVTNTASDSYIRTFEEWERFGARWWMHFVPPSNHPILGSIWTNLRSRIQDGEILSTRISAQVLFPGFAIVGSLIIISSIALVRQLGRSREANREESTSQQFLIITVLSLFLLGIVPAASNPIRNFYPSTWLFDVSSIWRYTGRLSVFIIFLLGLLSSISLANRLPKTRSKKFAILSIVFIVGLSDAYLPITRTPNRTFRYNDASPIYKLISEDSSGSYAEIPQFGLDFPFDGSYYQVITRKKVLDKVGLSLADPGELDGRAAIDLLLLQLESLCDRQGHLMLSYLGITHLVVHHKRLDSEPENYVECGWKVVSRIEGPVPKSHEFFNDYNALLLEPIASRKEALAAIALYSRSQWSIPKAFDKSQEHQSVSNVAKIGFARRPRENRDGSLVFNIDTEADVVIDCPKGHKKKLEVRLSRGLQKIELPKDCAQMTITSINSLPFTVTDLLVLR